MVRTAVLAPATVLARFRLKGGLLGDTDGFADAYTDRVDRLRRQDGFRRTTLLRSVRDPQTYVSVGSWADEWSFRVAARNAGFPQSIYGPLAPLADYEVDRTTPVSSGQADGAREVLDGGRPALALTTFAVKRGVDPRAFERGFTEHADFVCGQDGYLAHELSVLSNRSRTYVNLGWWRDLDTYLTVQRGRRMRQVATRMAGFVDATGEQFLTVATYRPMS
jgi:heme-degrading monooxygenase HmoA